MTKVLIPTIHDDIHAAAVALVLKDMGHDAIRWFCSDLPSCGAASFEIGGDEPERISIVSSAKALQIGDCDVFWSRRVGEPVASDQLSSADRAVALKESKVFVRGLLMSVSRRRFSVNDYESARSAENKLLQLSAATQVGLTIPPTLISNDPWAVRAFLDRQAEHGSIFKSFKPVTWESNQGVAIQYTSKVTAHDLPVDAILRQTPGIFQRNVPKAFEVRVTCMGGELVAARLDSQRTQHGVIDWRRAREETMQVTALMLPSDVAERCRTLLARLGLVFGCIDFVVTPGGEYVFLEINQMGQFLWVEETCPELPLLQMFSDFLVSRDAEFRWKRAGSWISYLDVVDAAVELLERDRVIHPRPKPAHIVRE
ncbi:MAG: hypothetical protein RL701_2103 [Pseudomonadota bacterium]|jgi:hypothetical protein